MNAKIENLRQLSAALKVEYLSNGKTSDILMKEIVFQWSSIISKSIFWNLKSLAE